MIGLFSSSNSPGFIPRFIGVNLLMLTLSIFGKVWAMDLILDNSSLKKGASFNRFGNNNGSLNIVGFNGADISHNIIEKFNLDGGELIINNGSTGKVDEQGIATIDPNSNSAKSTKIIILEIIGPKKSDLKGTIKIKGNRAKIVLVNPYGIACDGCNFHNVDKVELRTGRIDSITNDKIKWEKEIGSEIKIQGEGVNNLEGSLSMESKKINIQGDVKIKEDLTLTARSSMVTNNSSNRSKDDQSKTSSGHGNAIEIKDVNISAKNIAINSLDEGHGIRILGRSDTQTMIISHGNLYINTTGKINLSSMIKAEGEVGIIGKNLVMESLTFDDSRQNNLIIDAMGNLKIKGANVELRKDTGLNSTKGSIKLIGNKVHGDGNLSAGDQITILSHGAISLNRITANNNISIVAKGEISAPNIVSNDCEKIRIYGEKLNLKSIEGTKKLKISGKNIKEGIKLNRVNDIEISDRTNSKEVKDFYLVPPLDIEGDFKFKGRSFNNRGILRAKNINLDLTDEFINGNHGEILAQKDFAVRTKHFANHREIKSNGDFIVMGNTFINDENSIINAGPIEIYLKGKTLDGNAFVQGLNATLESNYGGIELIAPTGGVYFSPSNNNSTKSRVFSRNGNTRIQAKGEVLFEGVQTEGEIWIDTVD